MVGRLRDDDGHHVVTVHHDVAVQRLRGECSCAVGLDCEHAAATALVVLALAQEHAAARAAAARQEVVGDWLAELGRHHRPPAAAAAVAPAPERVVAYVLDLRDGEPGLTVVQATPLARGGLSAGTVIAALGDPQRGAPAWVDVDDLRRIALLRAVTRAAPSATRVPLGRVHGALLEELAASDRLFWEHTRGAPLRYGPAIHTTLRWLPVPGEPDGHRLGVAGGLTILPARAGHYVDVAAGVLGPLELGVPPELVQRLIAGPPVPAAMRTTVARSLAPLLGPTTAAAAGAADDPEDDAGAEPMRPRLTAGLAPDDAGGAAIAVVAEAGYGDAWFPLASWDATRQATRDLLAEGRAAARLAELLATLPHGRRGGSSLELLADARALAERVVPRLRAEGWRCELDASFPHEAPLADVAFIERLRPVGDGRGWFALELGVEVAGRTVPLLPLLLQAIRDGELVIEPGSTTIQVGAGVNVRLPEGELVHVPAERLERWLRPLVELELGTIDAAGALRVPALIAAALDDEAPGRYAAPGALAAARAHLDALLTLAPRAEGATFAGALRPYQRLGLAWLRTLHDAGLGGLLADEMGLGKTVQVLAFLDELASAGALAGAPALVVAPRSVLGTWEREARRFAPQLAPRVHHGTERAAGATAAAELARAPLVITSYQTLVRDLELVREVAWRTVIFDEAQALKNPDTQLRAAAATLTADSRFAITGTPIENHLGELWSQLDLVVPGVLGRRRAFDAVYRRGIEQHGAAAPLADLRARLRPFLLRRTKEQVAVELPAKTEVVELIELEPAQRDLYESLRLTLDAQVHEALARAGVHASSMVILDALLKLRQCCCDPRLVKLPEARQVTASAKLDHLMAKLEELADSGRSVLVFSQFTSMLAIIERACVRAGISHVKLTGATRDRDDVIRRFQAGEARVFLLSLKAGGVGISLTRADTVIHYDPWWNPAAEAQATDRAHRIGQDKPVMVYKLVARGTLEEAIATLQDGKRQLTAAALRDGGVTHLAAEDLAALYQRVV